MGYSLPSDQERAMEIKQAAVSPNIAVATTAQTVASGIEKAALNAEGFKSIKESFQNFPLPSSGLNQLASPATIDLPNQYSSQLLKFNREASGLVPSSELMKTLSDSNLDVRRGASDLKKTLESARRLEIHEAEEKISKGTRCSRIELWLFHGGRSSSSSRREQQEEQREPPRKERHPLPTRYPRDCNNC